MTLDNDSWSEYFDSLGGCAERLKAAVTLARVPLSPARARRQGPALRGGLLEAISFDRRRDEIVVAICQNGASGASIRYFVAAPRSVTVEDTATQQSDRRHRRQRASHAHQHREPRWGARAMRAHRRPGRALRAAGPGPALHPRRRKSHKRESGGLDFAPRMSGDVAAATGDSADLARARSAAGSALPAPGTFLDRLTVAERDALTAIGRERAFPRGTVLMYQDEPADRIVILLEGRVKVTRIEGDGHESLLSIRDPGDLLGELSFVDGLPRVATVSTLEPVRALVTTGDELQRHLERTPRVAVVLLQILVSRFRESTLKRTQFANTDTMGRLAARIVELAERYGEHEGEAIAVESPLTREDLAAWTGASRAGAAEALRQLRELGWIDTERRKLLVLDIGALRARAG